MATHSGGLTRDPAEPAVRVRDLHRSFSEAGGVLNGLDLDIGAGEFVALIGRSGSGKSTLLRALAGLDRDVAGYGSVRVPDAVSVVFQDSRLLPWRRVLDNVTFGLRGRDADDRGRQALAEVGLEGRERAWPRELSGGEQQRVALARSLVRQPDLLLADEPFGALDALTRIRMHLLLRRLCERHRPAVLLVTHDVDEAIVLADRVIVLDDGVVHSDIRVEIRGRRTQADPEFATLRTRLLAELGVEDDHGQTFQEGSIVSLNLNLFIYPGGHHEAAWRYAGSAPERVLDIGYYQQLARRAEDAKLDAVFFADGPALADNIRYASRFRLEPFTWMSAIAAVTSRIGLIGTASTTYSEPYNVARLFASLDHLSNGRAGWNIVTTGAPNAAQNFGLEEHPVHAARYARAEEFLEVVTKLWDSWEDEAFVADAASGLFADTDLIHPIDHVGEHFSVAGPLNTARSPQGRPVYVQAGSSEDGRAFAAQWAEAIFTAHQTLGNAQEFYRDVKARARRVGRSPAQLKVLPGISPFIGSTTTEAQDLHDEFSNLTQPEYSLEQLWRLTGADLSSYDLDGPFPRDVVDSSGERGVSSRFQVVLDIVDREQPTIRQLLHRLAGARGHRVVVGTPEYVADQMQLWYESDAADGFNVMPPWLTGGFDVFVDEVVPILRKRGLFRTEYTGTTLREHYGLERPVSQYTRSPVTKETA